MNERNRTKEPEIVKDDPTRPYKAIAGAVGSAIGYGLADGLFDFNPWASGIATLVCAFAGAYAVSNPKKWVPVKKKRK